MEKTPGRFMARAKEMKDSESPKPWRRMRKVVVDSGGEGRCVARGRGREERSDWLGMRGGIVVIRLNEEGQIAGSRRYMCK